MVRPQHQKCSVSKMLLERVTNEMEKQYTKHVIINKKETLSYERPKSQRYHISVTWEPQGKTFILAPIYYFISTSSSSFTYRLLIKEKAWKFRKS